MQFCKKGVYNLYPGMQFCKKGVYNLYLGMQFCKKGVYNLYPGMQFCATPRLLSMVQFFSKEGMLRTWISLEEAGWFIWCTVPFFLV